MAWELGRPEMYDSQQLYIQAPTPAGASGRARRGERGHDRQPRDARLVPAAHMTTYAAALKAFRALLAKQQKLGERIEKQMRLLKRLRES